jgi:uncharacterized protein involved in exopolysaccharide biosynthesis
MTENKETLPTENVARDEEISLIDLFAVLLRYKWLIIGVTLFAIVVVLTISVVSLIQPPEKSILPNEYTPRALMLINESSSSSSLSSMLSSSGLGSLASLAGISAGGGSSYSGLAVYFAGTNSFLDPIIEKFNLIERYEIEEYVKAESRKALKEKLVANFDSDSGVFSISFTDIDPVFAAEVVNYAVSLMENMFLNLGIDKNVLEKKNLEENIQNSYNEIVRLQKAIQVLESSVSYGGASSVSSVVLEANLLKAELEAQTTVYSQLKTQLELLKIQMASDKPVFQIIESAEVPDLKSKPSRGMLCIIGTFAGFFISVFLAFLINAIKNIKNDPVAMEKLRKK